MDARRRPDRPWWAEGLPFSCTRCGKCCHARGGYQYVYLNERETRRLAGHLGLERRTFLARYTRLDEDGYRVLRFRAGRCVFLDGRLCRVHDARPEQCRTWPFWSENLVDPETWRREVIEFCPGSRRGPIHTAAEIRELALRTDAALYEDDPEAAPQR